MAGVSFAQCCPRSNESRSIERQLRALDVAQLGLFGSFVRNEAGPNSEVDLLVDFKPERKTFNGFLEVVDFLTELLGRDV
ncbi:nucleotidyltransferase family protein [Hymenobacter baengnokdamensis]|uniref:nucleotidyltransferase family protein n=1 Tax=Hymenobacter baengnokdamensis TaxID=2615203 RepID=UPI001E6277A0|nr:nucleotidyltransferase domain-containing protein [Hymenobacter baengnokdamensis]